MSEAWWLPGAPGTRDVPWLHPAIVLYLDALIQPHWTVLEHGSGGSTRWFAKRAQHVVSVERDPAWQQVTESQVDGDVVRFYNGTPETLVAEMPGTFDLMLIDGARDERPAWCAVAGQLVRPGGIVVLDNSNRPEYTDARAALQRIAEHGIVFATNPPGFRNAVTDMYRMKGGADDENWI